MSDTSFSTFEHYGTNAERLAFTPSPPSGAQPLYVWYETDTDNYYFYTTAWKGPFSAAASGKFVKRVNTQVSSESHGTTLIPYDDTIPQNTEGFEVMTKAITPSNSSNKLQIDIVVAASDVDSSAVITVALFQDSTANALAANPLFNPTGTGPQTIAFSHTMTAGTTSSTTFKVRIGANAGSGPVTFNGNSSARKYGGVGASSITITEYIP